MNSDIPNSMTQNKEKEWQLPPYPLLPPTQRNKMDYPSPFYSISPTLPSPFPTLESQLIPTFHPSSWASPPPLQLPSPETSSLPPHHHPFLPSLSPKTPNLDTLSPGIANNNKSQEFWFFLAHPSKSYKFVETLRKLQISQFIIFPYVQKLRSKWDVLQNWRILP